MHREQRTGGNVLLTEGFRAPCGGHGRPRLQVMNGMQRSACEIVLSSKRGASCFSETFWVVFRIMFRVFRAIVRIESVRFRTF